LFAKHGDMAGVTPVRPDVEFPDVVLPDQNQLAQTVSTLGAQAASVKQRRDGASARGRVADLSNASQGSRGRIASGVFHAA
jgi:hypothetical protein